MGVGVGASAYRLFSVCRYESLHSACLDRVRLDGSLTGVILGFAASDFMALLFATPAGCSVYAATGWPSSIASGRLSYVLGLHGPCASYDTACSSALVAYHSCHRALQWGESTSSLAAGVNMMLSPTPSVIFAIASLTSARGRSFTWDTQADGYARCEACCTATVQPTIASGSAIVDGLGVSVRQDGRSASLTAPNGRAQQGLLAAALSDAGSPVDMLVLNEAHGTGTALGDPIEAGSLVAAVLSSREDVLAVGGVKANIGHAEPAAGMTGLLKLAVGLWAGAAAPNAQLRALNSHVGNALRDVSCTLSAHQGKVMSEAAGGGISSFGYSGVIAHAVLAIESEAHARRTVEYSHEVATIDLQGAGATAGAPLTRCSQMDAERPPFASSPHAPLAYQRRTFSWRDPSHPLAKHGVPSQESAFVFRSPVAGPLNALVADHVVQGRVIFPASAYIEMARAAGATSLCSVYFLQPLAVEAPSLLIECAVSAVRFDVRSGEDGPVEDATVHCSGATGSSVNWQIIDRASLRAPCHAADVGALYDNFDAVDLQYGPGYRTLLQAWGSASIAVARLRARSAHEGTQVHPADLDDALCMSGVIASNGGDGGGDAVTHLPFAVDDALLQGGTSELWAVRRSYPAYGCSCVTPTAARACSFARRLWLGNRPRRSRCRLQSSIRGPGRGLMASSRACCGLRCHHSATCTRQSGARSMQRRSEVVRRSWLAMRLWLPNASTASRACQGTSWRPRSATECACQMRWH